MILYYIIPMVAGPYSRTNAQRPDYVDEIQCNWSGHNVDALGMYVCMVNTTAAKHADLASRAGVVQMPSVYTWDTVVSTTQAAARNRIRNFLLILNIAPYTSTETIGDVLQRVINSGLWDLGNVAQNTIFSNLNQGQQNKIISICKRLGLPTPTASETVSQLSKRTGPMVWPGNDRSIVNVGEF
jgi:hypothetical protein